MALCLLTRHINNKELNWIELWKEAAVVWIFKRGNNAAMCNYRPISVPKNFSKLFQFIIQNHISHYAKFNQISLASPELNRQVPILWHFRLLGSCCQRLADDIYFDLSNVFDLVPHNVLLHELGSFGFSVPYVGWFHSYLPNRQSRVCFPGTLSFSSNIRRVARLCSGTFVFN
jgi:hypothetical protein